ncbi:MAG: hypothetical protein A3K66_01030 [Euryarchaeota archaeon RBG_16_67_27]|nr:MAG: hypothetical protein A3K66_01030 [Euryarchaeota archaeon RBG_16_67_27]
MNRRKGVFATFGLVAVLLVGYVLAAALAFPSASLLSGAVGTRAPDSTVEALPEYTNRAVIEIRYAANGTAGSSGVFWTELYYRVPGKTNWTLYAPPWNPDGRWFGQLGFSTGALVEGTILFDTYYTGGEATYELSTRSVDRGYWYEAEPRNAKARTTLDTRPPQLFVASPTPQSWTREKTLKWIAVDEVSGVAAVEYDLDGTFVASSDQASGEAPLDLTSEGSHAVVVRAKDRAGNVALVPVAFHYDPNSPVLHITAPARDGYVNSKSVEVRWDADDTGSGLASLRLSVDSIPPIELAGATRAYTLQGLEERGHVVNLVATDLAGNVASETLSFGIDTKPPTVQLLAPRDGGYANRRDVQVLWLGSDEASGIAQFEVVLEGRDPVIVKNAASFTFTNVPDGARSFRVRAVDRAGNAGDATSRVTVDATAPSVEISSPNAGDTVYGPLEIGWSASDAGSGVEKVEFLYDDGVPTVVTGAQTHRVEGAALGPHFVLVRVWDRAGNSAEVGRAFAYGGATPPDGGPFNIGVVDFWLLMAAIAAIAVVSAYYAVRRRKRAQA